MEKIWHCYTLEYYTAVKINVAIRINMKMMNLKNSEKSKLFMNTCVKLFMLIQGYISSATTN